MDLESFLWSWKALTENVKLSLKSERIKSIVFPISIDLSNFYDSWKLQQSLSNFSCAFQFRFFRFQFELSNLKLFNSTFCSEQINFRILANTRTFEHTLWMVDVRWPLLSRNDPQMHDLWSDTVWFFYHGKPNDSEFIFWFLRRGRSDLLHSTSLSLALDRPRLYLLLPTPKKSEN